jgi:hypothetical protein
MDHLQMLSWANRHVESVEESAKAFMGKGAYIASSDPEIKREFPHSLDYPVHVRLHEPVIPPPEDAPFHIGDALHAMRVSLDYLAVHVVLKANRRANESKVAFPIALKHADFCSQAGMKFQGIGGDLIAAFEAAQPYSGIHGRRPKRHPLAILDRLEQPHKHRRRLQAYPRVYDYSFVVTRGSPRDVECVHITVPTVPIPRHHNAEIARLRIATNANGQPKAQVENHLRFFVCFQRKGPAFGAPAITLLKMIRDHIRDEVFPLFDSFV